MPELLYRGKTKDVFAEESSGPSERVRFVFTDRVTLNDQGVIDPGGNNVAEAPVLGQAEACLKMTSAIFRELSEKGFATHMVSYDLAALSMVVKKAKLFSPGLEWVGRWVATGSFVRRYSSIPTCRDGFRLPSPVWEITLKDDAAGDPLIAPSAITALGLMDSATLEDLWAANDQVMRALHDMFSARGLDLWDIKIEWGLDENGRPLLIDEISPGCCRAFKKGSRERAVGLELAEYFTRSK